MRKAVMFAILAAFLAAAFAIPASGTEATVTPLPPSYRRAKVSEVERLEAENARLRRQRNAHAAQSRENYRRYRKERKARRKAEAAHKRHHVARYRTALASVYGGASEAQAVAGPYPGTRTLEARGVRYVAHKSMRFGTRIEFRYRGKTSTAVVVDRGPYCGGRTFDLGVTTARDLGFGGVGTVQYRIVN